MRISDWSSDVCSSDLVDLSRIQPSGAAGADTEARHTDGAVQVLRDSCAAEAAAGANARGSTVMPNLQNKIAIVTGAARGQGAAQARRLVEDGASVVPTAGLDGLGSSEERSVGTVCVSTWRSRWSPTPFKKNHTTPQKITT